MPFQLISPAPLLLVLLLFITGCSASIVPPSAVQQPVTVYVLDHGRHSSLVLPAANGGIRYSYGDWNYYVLRDTSLRSGLRALLIPSRSALGRQVLPLTLDAETLPSQLSITTMDVLAINVEAEHLNALRARLEALFSAGGETLDYSEVFDTEFVAHPQPYTLRYNSNRMVGAWLEELGCEIRGLPILSRWRLLAIPPEPL